MIQKEHHIIISLASNINHEANLEAARTQLTQLLSELPGACDSFTYLGSYSEVPG